MTTITYAGIGEADRRRVARKVWAGYGSGEQCDYCGAPIRESDVELELELMSGDLRFHRACLRLWEAALAD
jgi:hypothetical protein